jgi:hypothetical protein
MGTQAQQANHDQARQALQRGGAPRLLAVDLTAERFEQRVHAFGVCGQRHTRGTGGQAGVGVDQGPHSLLAHCQHMPFCTGVSHNILLDPAIPFGGNRSAGIGREFGSAVIEDYTELKSVMIRY